MNSCSSDKTSSISESLDLFLIDDLISKAIYEDLSSGDLTTTYTIDQDNHNTCHIYCKSPFIVVCGLKLVKAVFCKYDPSLEIIFHCKEGQHLCFQDNTPINNHLDKKNNNLVSELDPQRRLLSITGKVRSILTIERVALNFLAKMCAIATHSKNYCDVISSTNSIMLDTRKTTPGLKIIEKYSTRIGGVKNHRFNLSDGVLIKENHLKSSKNSLAQMLDSIKNNAPITTKAEVEVSSLKDALLAYNCGADMIMLDNMPIEKIHQCVSALQGKIPLEASGNIDLHNLLNIAQTGVDYISTSDVYFPPRCDLSLLVQ